MGDAEAETDANFDEAMAKANENEAARVAAVEAWSLETAKKKAELAVMKKKHDAADLAKYTRMALSWY